MNLPIVLTPEGQKAFRAARAWLYAVTIPVLALLLYRGVLKAEEVPLWLAVIGAVLGIASPTAALANLTPIKPTDPTDPPPDGTPGPGGED
jgi:hypothetical protein